MIQKAKALSVIIDEHDLLVIKHKFSQDLFKRVIDQGLPLIFTSKIAAGLFLEKAKGVDLINPIIYAIKGATSELIEKDGFRVAGHAQTGSELAALILSHGIEKAIFLCGDIHRAELPDLLSGNKVELIKHAIYQKEAVGFKATMKYNGYMFFSPSQVDIFFEFNQPDPGSPMFCIGKTTASQLRSKGMKEVIYPSESRVENVISLAMKFLKHEQYA